MSLEKPRPRTRSWGFSLGGLFIGIDAPGAQVGVQIRAMVANAASDTDESRPGHPVPPLGELFAVA